MGSSKTVYVSIPDPQATTTSGSNCASLNLPVLPAGYAYHCSGPSFYQKTDGTGWIPISFSSVTLGSSLGTLPIDPINASPSRLYYTYTTNGSQYETTAVMESPEYKLGGTNDVISQDGGTLASVYEKGTKLGLEPLDYGDPSLVGYWTLDEGSGSTVYDYSGNNATGSWQGTLGSQWASGRVGNRAGNFNGSDNYVDVGNSSIIEPTSAGTYSAWINPVPNCNPTMGWGVVMANEDVYWDLNGVGILCDDSGGIGLEISNASTYIDTPPYIYSPNTWFLVTGTWNGSMVDLYVNGALVESTPQTIVPTPLYHTFIGTDPYMPINGPFGGMIDDVRIYNRALSASEIQAMYNGGK
jgi:hypothetical protein